MTTGAGDAAAVVVYSTRFCPYCIRARHLLDTKGVEYREILVDMDLPARQDMERLSGARTVPQIFVGTRLIGGFDALRALENSGELDRILMGPSIGVRS